MTTLQLTLHSLHQAALQEASLPGLSASSSPEAPEATARSRGLGSASTCARRAMTPKHRQVPCRPLCHRRPSPHRQESGPPQDFGAHSASILKPPQSPPAVQALPSLLAGACDPPAKSLGPQGLEPLNECLSEES